MSDEHDDETPKNPGRDARGRWQKGHCPNPKGRPKKKEQYYDPTDLLCFRNTLIDVKTAGQSQRMTRREALLGKMFESAMNGRVTMQRFLYSEFARKDEETAEFRAQYDELIRCASSYDLEQLSS